MPTPLQGYPFPDALTGNNVPLDLEALAVAVERRSVMIFTSAVHRTGAFALAGISPSEGMMSYLLDLHRHEHFNGTTWVPIPGANVARGIMATAISTAANGTSTAADTVEVRDAVLGDYEFVAETGRQYELKYPGLLANSSVADARFIVRIRDGGASTPTTGSPLIAEGQEWVGESLSAGRTGVKCEGLFTAATGVHKIGAFTQSPDGVVMTPTSLGAAGRQLYVVDIGPA